MRRNLHRLTIAAAVAALSCAEYPVERCAAGEGIPLDNREVPCLGERHAPVTVTLFGDFQCPFTHEMAVALDAKAKELEAEGKSDEMRLLFRHFPIESIHPRARAAAIAAAAAHRQGDEAFFRFFWYLFKPTSGLTDEKILEYAEFAGLDMERFASDLADPAVEAVVDRDLALAESLELPGAPSVLLCGYFVGTDRDQVLDNLDYLVDR